MQTVNLNGRRKDALAGDRRRANEEANLPLAGNDDGLGLGRGRSQLHDDDDGSSSGNGHHRVHDDAQLAVIGVGLVGVEVRDLGYGQHRQQEQAEDCHGRQEAGRDAPPARLRRPWRSCRGKLWRISSRACQSHYLPCDLQLLFYRKLTEVWTRWAWRGCT